jgi:glycerol-3-phosphate dehydrogenase (NAD(P)+)
MKKIAVIGAGSWGLALALLLNEKKNQVTVWCYEDKEKEEILKHRENKRCLPGIKLPLDLQFTTCMQEAVENKDVVVLAVPSGAVRSTTEKLKNFVCHESIIVNVAKGIEEDSLLRLSEVIASIVPNPVVVLSGPSHAEEVARHIPTTVTVTSANMQKAEEVQELFMNKYFRVYTNPDVIGVELGGALKNVIALAAGIIEGVGYGDNTKAALITRGIAEMARLGVAMGGDVNTFAGLTGIGDLIVTCTSGHSRNRRAGELIGQGYSLDEAIQKVNMVVEGVPTTKAGYQLMQTYKVEMPILSAIYKCMFEGSTVQEAIEALMMRDKKMEQL